MRICTICKLNEPRNNSSSYCKSCHNEKQKAYYKANPASVRQTAVENKQKVRELIIQAKDKPCTDCGVKYPYYVMDLDHAPDSEKKFNLSEAARKYTSIARVTAEIAKCEVVCSNCHRERTFKRLSSIQNFP